MSLFQSGTIYLQKTNFDELFFKLYLVKKSLFVGIVSFLFIALLCSLNLVYF